MNLIQKSDVDVIAKVADKAAAQATPGISLDVAQIAASVNSTYVGKNHTYLYSEVESTPDMFFLDKSLSQTIYAVSAITTETPLIKYSQQVVHSLNLNQFSNEIIDANAFDKAATLFFKKNKPFIDVSFRMTVPLDADESTDSGLLSLTDFYQMEIKPTYNYYDDYFENGFNLPHVTENLIPNFYQAAEYAESVFALSKKETENFSEEKLKYLSNQLTWHGTITEKEISSLIARQGKTEPVKPITSYYSILGKKINKLTPKSAQLLGKKQANYLLVSEANVSSINQFDEHRYTFPMFIDFEFDTDKKTSFCELMRACGLTDSLLKTVANDTLKEHPFSETIDLILANNLGNKVSVVDLGTKIRKYFDLEEWLKANFNKDNSKITDNQFVGKRNAVNAENTFVASLMKVIFTGKLNEFIENNLRDYTQIAVEPEMRTLAYAETLFYVVEKYEGTTVGGDPLFRYFVPNVAELEKVKLTDTQVKYGKDYTYVVKAYQLVLGNELEYTERGFSGGVVAQEVKNSPKLWLVEVPVGSRTAKILDKPPLPPDVNLVTYLNNDSKLQIQLNYSPGSATMKPLIIEPSDTKIFQAIAAGQKKSLNKFIDFGGDDTISFCEVFRTEFKPKVWSDFRGNKLHTLSTDGTSATSIVDVLKPNTKYYYTFRAIDVHGHLSNPTNIYEVELINDGGTIYSNTEVIGFEEIEKDNTKRFRRFLQIKPAFRQLLLNKEKTDLKTIQADSKITLGVNSESVWDKYFIAKITSRSSGKSIFVKFNFDYTTVADKT